ncbi:MAG: hypothetical protein ABR923_11060 [Terracidiphilus sp.]
MKSPNVRHVSWWRIGLGLLLLLGGLGNLDRGNITPALTPPNETQWSGYYFANAAVIVVGLWLIFFGVLRAWRRPRD